MKRAFFIVVCLLASCYSKTPETIIGMKFGLNASNQIREAYNSQKLKHDPIRPYIEFSNGLRGHTKFFELDGNLAQIWVHFINPQLHSIVESNSYYFDPAEFLITKEDKDFIINIYEKKYGFCKQRDYDGPVEQDQVFSSSVDHKHITYDWKKGHLIISLSVHEQENRLWTAIAMYSYDYDYEKEIKNKSENRKNDVI